VKPALLFSQLLLFFTPEPLSIRRLASSFPRPSILVFHQPLSLKTFFFLLSFRAHHLTPRERRRFLRSPRSNFVKEHDKSENVEARLVTRPVFLDISCNTVKCIATLDLGACFRGRLGRATGAPRQSRICLVRRSSSRTTINPRPSSGTLAACTRPSEKAPSSAR